MSPSWFLDITLSEALTLNDCLLRREGDHLGALRGRHGNLPDRHLGVLQGRGHIEVKFAGVNHVIESAPVKEVTHVPSPPVREDEVDLHGSIALLKPLEHLDARDVNVVDTGAVNDDDVEGVPLAPSLHLPDLRFEVIFVGEVQGGLELEDLDALEFMCVGELFHIDAHVSGAAEDTEDLGCGPRLVLDEEEHGGDNADDDTPGHPEEGREDESDHPEGKVNL